MTIALAAVLLSFLASPAQSPMKPSRPGEGIDERVAAIVARIHDSSVRDHENDIAALQETGLSGVRWLVERAVVPDPDGYSTSMLVWFQPSGEHIVEHLLPHLQDDDDRARLWWGVALANVTPPPVDALIREFASDDRARKLAAARAARCFCEHYEAVAPKLASLTDDPDADVRYWATFALGGLAPASLPALFHALENKDARVRAAAAEGIQKSFYPYLTDKKSSDWGGYSTWHGLPPGMEMRELSNAIVARDGVGPLREVLKDENEDVRFFAAMALFELGSVAVAARPELEAALADPSPGVRMWAAHALERTDPTPWIRLKRLAVLLRAKDAAPEPLDDATFAKLSADLDHQPEWSPLKKEHEEAWSTDPDVRFDAVRAITTRGLDRLLVRASSQDPKQAESAAHILDALERELDRRIAKLIRILDAPFGGMGPEAGALIELGPVAMPALEHVLLRYPRFPMGSPTYYAVANVLTKIGEPALPATAVGLGHWRDCGRVFSTQILLAAQEKSAPLAPAIVSAWRSVGADVRIPGTDVRWDSKRDRFYDGYSGGASNTRGLKSLGTSILPTLVRALDDPHGPVRMRAATSLGSFGKEGAPALQALVRRLGDDQRYVAEAVADAILLIAPSESPEAESARAKLDERRRK